MPVIIRKVEDDHFVNFEEIAGDEWKLREQVEALEEWLQNNPQRLDPQFRWVADIGFEQRKGAMGGGPPLTFDLMKLCLGANLEIYLSEYPRRCSPSGKGDQLRDEVRNEMNSEFSAMNSAEKLLLAEAVDDLDMFEDEPEGEFYNQAKLVIKLLENLQDSETKKLFILYCLYDLLGADENLPVRQLIDALQANGE